jgi:hypothetical protein
MTSLLGLEEMQQRHTKGEDPFELVIEKWLRIKDYLLENAEPERYKEAYECGVSKIIFCLDFRTYCHLCPLSPVCSNNQSLYYQIMRHLHVYSLLGALLPRAPIIDLIDKYIMDMQGYRDDWLKKSQ